MPSTRMTPLEKRRLDFVASRYRSTYALESFPSAVSWKHLPGYATRGVWALSGRVRQISWSRDEALVMCVECVVNKDLTVFAGLANTPFQVFEQLVLQSRVQVRLRLLNAEYGEERRVGSLP